MTRTSDPLRAAALGLAAVVTYAVWAAIQIMVLNPLAAAPGRTLAEIHADADAAAQSLPIWQPLLWLGVGVALAIALFAVVLANRSIARSTVVALYLGLLVLGAPGYFAASFLWGMNLADTYGIGGADHSPWALPLYAVSLAAGAGLVIMALSSIADARSRRPREA